MHVKLGAEPPAGEIDFETLDELVMRKLFVRATRAMMKLVPVMSERAAVALSTRLQAD